MRDVVRPEMSVKDLWNVCGVLTSEARVCEILATRAKSKLSRTEWSIQAAELRSLSHRLAKTVTPRPRR